MDDYVPKNQSNFNKALDARDLSQDALANEVMKRTNVPLPNKGVAPAKMEDFLNRVVSERYPEFKDPNISVRDLSHVDAHGLYNKGAIAIDPSMSKNPMSALGTALHEAGHKYDDEILKKGSSETLEQGMKNVRNGGIIKHADPSDVYEALAKGHHANIPDLREGSYGLGALKSMLKSGTFKAIAPLSTISQITPSLIDLKEGNSNTAAARMLTSLAPVGSEQLQEKLMQDAQLQDKSPELSDPSYMKTLQNIGERRRNEGRSPVVESISGQKVDTSATEPSDFENLVKKRMILNAQG